ncbi:MAG TPA: PepSY-associated TM helix domain-containing protein [Burkholderiales bacterium]|nr:PepSY-associated TM helix domain-containing protein [Burkholderiales bacterium]
MFQIHLWTGIILGLHLAVVSVTGVMLLFKDEMLTLAYPHLYSVEAHAANSVNVTPDIDTIIGSANADYPGYRILRIDAAKAGRDTVVIIAENQGTYHRIFAHPETGTIIGKLPKPSAISSVEELHSSLLAGGPGQIINSILALFALLLVFTGVIIWWPGTGRWWKALGLRPNGGKISMRALHRTVGIWTFGFIAMFAATGSLFYFDRFLNRAVDRISEVSSKPDYYSNANLSGTLPRPEIQPLIDSAQQAAPGRKLWGIHFPGAEYSPIHVVFGPVGKEVGRDRWDWSERGQRNFYFDQYTGEALGQWDTTNDTLADIVRAWPVKLHTGEFGGAGVRVLWVVTGLAPLLLFVLGFLMWWKRVIQPRSARQNAGS